MTFEEIQARDSRYVMNTYARFPVDIDHGENATLYDAAGKAYIDFSSGIGVNSVGAGNEKWLKAITDQAQKLGHISNLFYTQPCGLLAETLCRRTGMKKAFFCNSGAEANEGLIKLARKYSFDKYGKGRGTVITLFNSFHGRTITTLAATGQEKFHDYFFPFTEGFRYAENTIDGIAAVAGHDVCAVLVELVQGEGGVIPQDKSFIQDLEALCAQRDWLFLVDEVQTGVGRTGTFFCYQQYGVQPDAISFAKGIAGGLPLGGILAGEKCMDVFTPGTHAATFGGNPVCCAAALAVQEILDDTAVDAVAEKGRYLRAAIEDMDLPQLGATRGLGLMIGVEVKEGYVNRDLAVQMMEKGLICLTAGHNTLRLLPPLTITKEEIDKGLEIMKAVLSR